MKADQCAPGADDEHRGHGPGTARTPPRAGNRPAGTRCAAGPPPRRHAASLCSAAGRPIPRDGARHPRGLQRVRLPGRRTCPLPSPGHRPASTYGVAVMPVARPQATCDHEPAPTVATAAHTPNSSLMAGAWHARAAGATMRGWLVMTAGRRCSNRRRHPGPPPPRPRRGPPRHPGRRQQPGRQPACGRGLPGGPGAGRGHPGPPPPRPGRGPPRHPFLRRRPGRQPACGRRAPRHPDLRQQPGRQHWSPRRASGGPGAGRRHPGPPPPRPGEDHPDTLASASNLVMILGEDRQAARELAEDILARRRRVLGEDHPEHPGRRLPARLRADRAGRAPCGPGAERRHHRPPPPRPRR